MNAARNHTNTRMADLSHKVEHPNKLSEFEDSLLDLLRTYQLEIESGTYDHVDNDQEYANESGIGLRHRSQMILPLVQDVVSQIEEL